MEMVSLERVETEQDIQELHSFVHAHNQKTGSSLAARVLQNWDQALNDFVKVMPNDYKRVLQEMEQAAAEKAVTFAKNTVAFAN